MYLILSVIIHWKEPKQLAYNNSKFKLNLTITNKMSTRATRTLGRGGAQDVGPSGHGYGQVGFADVDRSPSGARRGTMPSSASPIGKTGGVGILKKRTGGHDEDPAYLRSIKEDAAASDFNADDSRWTQHEGEGQRMDRSLSKLSGSRVEDSLRDPHRPAKNIPGLVSFLIEEHRNRLGIFTQDAKKLFKFWKRYVSHAYRQERLDQLDKKRHTSQFGDLEDQYTLSGALKPMKGGNINMLDSGLGPDARSSFTAHQTQQARKMFVKGQRASSALRLSDKKPQTMVRPREGGTLQKYDQFGWLAEFDVSFTIHREIELMNDKNKSRKLKIHNEAEKKRQEYELERWKAKIARAVKEYYDYKSEIALHAHVAQREKEAKEKAKKVKKDDKNPAASAKQKTGTKPPKAAGPGATMLSPGDLKSQLQAAEAENKDKKKKLTIFDILKPKCDAARYEEITSENARKQGDMTVILNVVLAAKFEENFVRQEMIDDDVTHADSAMDDSQAPPRKRKSGPLMANTLEEVDRLYNRNRARAERTLSGGDPKALLADFYRPQEIVLRLDLYRCRINTSRARGSVPLHAFYLSAPQHERLAFLFDVREPEKRPHAYAGEDDKEKAKTEAEKYIAEYVRTKEEEYMKRRKIEEDRAQRLAEKHEAEVKKKVFGESYKDGKLELKNRPDYTLPKDKWKLGRQLKELQKEFPHDRVLQRMIEEEFKSNQTFKYPEEYDLYDGAAEGSFKKNFDGEVVRPDAGEFAWKVPDFSRETEVIQTFKNKDTYKRKEAREYQKAEAEAAQGLEDELRKRALRYHDHMAKRGKLAEGVKKTTLRRLLAENYQEIINGEYGDVAKQRFPHISYGQDVNSETFKQSYPASFKRYFFQLVKCIIVSRKGRGKKFQHKPVTLTMLAPSREPGPRDAIAAPSYNTKLQEFTVGQAAKELRTRDPAAWRTRVFRRRDQDKKLKNVFMTLSEVENCTFEPAAGCLDRHWGDRIWSKAVSSAGDERMRAEAKPGEFFDRLGLNFCKAEPAIYKRGKMKKAKIWWRQGDADMCFRTLAEGFNLPQLFQYHEPAKYKAWKDFKQHEEKIAKQADQAKKEALRGSEPAIPTLSKERSLLKRETHDDLNPQQLKDVKAVFAKMKKDPPRDPGSRHIAPPYITITDLTSAIQQLGQQPQPYEIADIEKKIRMERSDEVRSQFKHQIDQSQLNKQLEEVKKAPIHITEDMLVSIMSVRLKVTLSDQDLKAAFRLFDADESGALDAAELREVLLGLGDQFTEEEVELMIQEADADGSGKIEEDEFVNVMRNKASKLASKGGNWVSRMQQEIKMFLQLAETKKAYARMGKGLIGILDQASQKVEDELKEHPDKKQILTEDVGKAAFRALYDECWDLFQEIIKRAEELERRAKQIGKRQKKLEKTQKELDKQIKENVEVEAEEDGAEAQDWRKLFKTIMCPLKHECPKLMPPRWPASKHKAITRFGKNCPYAHHPMELQFPQTLSMRIAANKAMSSKDPSAAPAKRWVHGGDLHDCGGCGTHCNMCSYKKLAQETVDSMAAKLAKKSFAQMDKDQVNERYQRNNRERDNFAKKFGILKKASVLLYYGRANDAFDEIAKAALIIKEEDEFKTSQEEIIKAKWQAKLGLDDLELPVPANKIRPEDVTEQFLKSLQGDAGSADLATLKIYIHQVCPLVRDQNDRNTFLNGLIEDLYHQCEDKMIDKKNTIDKLKKNVEQLGQVAEVLDQLGSDVDKADLDDIAADFEDGAIQIPRKKKTMCEKIQKKKYYMKEEEIPMKTMKGEDKYWVDNKYERKTQMDPKTGREGCVVCNEWRSEKYKNGEYVPQQKRMGTQCKHAHNAIELDFTPLEDKIKNLNNVIKAQTHQLKNDRPKVAWRPSAKNFNVNDLPDYSKKPKKSAEEEEAENKKPKRKGILDRDDVLKKPYEKE